MPSVRVSGFGVSLDGYGAGPDQSLEHPLGVHGTEIMGWLFPTRTFQQMTGTDGGETGRDDQMALRAAEGIGAWIMGRNMFGPLRGPWGSHDWKGWWGDTPPFRTSVFVLTHHARAPIRMDGGTTFVFVTDGIESALRQAREAAAGRDVRIGGGVNTVRRYLKARLVDELHLAVSPAVMGRGEHLMHGLDLRALGYQVTDQVPGERAMHMFIRRRAA